MLFTGRMKLADLISANHELIGMLPRFGIPLGFGDKSVAEICAIHGVPPDFFLLICNVYSFDTYLPDIKDIINIDMSPLVPYLTASHNSYKNVGLPHIEYHLNRIADGMNNKYGTVLKRFFAGYKNEVLEHFLYEEETVFPYINSLINNEVNADFSIRNFEQAHNNIEDKLDDLKQIIFKYMPSNTPQGDSISVVLDIFHLSADLNKHTLIENKVLVPYVKSLEKK